MRRLLFIIPLLFLLPTAQAGYLDLSWDNNHETDLAGYNVYYGMSSGEYINFIDVGSVTTYRMDDLLDDVIFYITVTAYDTAGNESDFSEEVSGVGSVDDPPAEPVDVRKSKAGKTNRGSQKGRKSGWLNR